MKAPVNPLSQGTSPKTGLVHAAICGTKKYLSTLFRAGKEVPNVVFSLTVLGLRFLLPETLRRYFLRAVAAAAFFVLVAAATSASCRGTSQQNIALQMFLQLQTLRRPLSRPVAAGVFLWLLDVAASQYVCSRGADKTNDHVIHGVSMVTKVIDSCSQAGSVPQAIGDHVPTPCRRPKEEVDVPTFLLQISTLDATRATKGPQIPFMQKILKTLETRSTFPC